jgi:putative membrane protein
MMLRRSFVLALGALGLAGLVHVTADAREALRTDFRTADRMDGAFAMQSSQLALTRTSNPDIINFANVEIAEQLQVATMLIAVPGTGPLRPDHGALKQGGDVFDRMYVQGQIRGHRELLALNGFYIRTGSNPREQEVAQTSRSIIRRHLATLSSLREIG